MNFDLTLRPDLILSGLFALLYALTVLYTSVIPQGSRRWALIVGMMCALLIAGLLVEPHAARFILLNLAALTAAGLVWTQPGAGARIAARAYLVMILASMVFVGLGLYLAGLFTGQPATFRPVYPLDRLIGLLLITGFALKLALVPFYFWLTGIASSTSPMTTALIVTTVDIAEFGELTGLRHTINWVFSDFDFILVWLALALLTLLGGALLALAQRDIKRMLVFSTIDDMGYLLLGVLMGTNSGMQGVFTGLISHALFKFLMFGAVGIAECGLNTRLTLDCRGLAHRFPVSSAAYITGALGVLGIPPLLGFSSRWRIYFSALEVGGFSSNVMGIGLLAIMLVATGIALFYHVRAIHRVWFGPMTGPELPASVPSTEPRPALAALVITAGVGLILGLLPRLLPLLDYRKW